MDSDLPASHKVTDQQPVVLPQVFDQIHGLVAAALQGSFLLLFRFGDDDPVNGLPACAPVEPLDLFRIKPAPIPVFEVVALFLKALLCKR